MTERSRSSPDDEIKLLIDELIVCALTCEQAVASENMKEYAALQHQCAEACFQAAHQLIQTSQIDRIDLVRCAEFCKQYANKCLENNINHVHSATIECAQACTEFLERTV
jgi:hypothetical protein